MTNQKTINEFINTVEDEKRRNDSRELIRIMQEATNSTPTLWGSIVRFGKHHYKYETGREGDTVAVGFSPRKNALALYGLLDHEENLKEVSKLGKFKLGKGCLYINKLSDIDTSVLAEMIIQAYKHRNNAE